MSDTDAIILIIVLVVSYVMTGLVLDISDLNKRLDKLEKNAHR